MKRSLPLKYKLTITSAVILTAMCVIFATSSISSAHTLVDAAKLVPSKPIADGMPVEPASGDALVELEAAQIATAPATAALGQFRGTAIGTMACLIVFGAALTYVFAAKTLKPLEKLTETVNNINIHNLDEKIPLPGTGDEVDRLTESFNDMTAKLNQAYQVQKNFSANAAHELRTPLALLQTQVDVFQMRAGRSVAEYNALLRSISESTDRLSHLVNDLLSFTTEQEVSMTEEVNLRELLEETAFELEESAAARQIQIEISGEGVVHGSDRLLQRAFYNLISNAIRYNVEGGKILVQISKERVTVADTGIGIPDEAKPNIFHSFFCVDKSRSRELGGSGLGLAIVKNIIEKHQGSICVRDYDPQGSIFVIDFPGEKTV